MDQTTRVATVEPTKEMYHALLDLMSGIVHRDTQDEGDLWDVKEHLLPKAFAKYFASDDYAKEVFKETEFKQYTWMLRNLSELEKFVYKYGAIVMKEWDRALSE